MLQDAISARMASLMSWADKKMGQRCSDNTRGVNLPYYTIPAVANQKAMLRAELSRFVDRGFALARKVGSSSYLAGLLTRPRKYITLYNRY